MRTAEMQKTGIEEQQGAEEKGEGKEAKNNPQWKAAKIHSARKLVAFMEELGIINGAVRWRWKLAGLIG